MANSEEKAKAPSGLTKLNNKIYVLVVWLLRLTIGALFIFAGFTKAVDPWGFYYKIVDYLNVWGIDWLWRETVLAIAIGLSALEFTCGVLLLTGSLRRSICWIILAIMAFMLPLTAYIWAYNPVADCGCFGDALVISNRASFFKNVYITLGTLYLIKYNNKVTQIFSNLVQWMEIVASIFYCLALSTMGYNIQPLIDFRPFPVGSSLTDDTEDAVRMVYERDGEQKEFDVDSLPDSTWTYVGRSATAKDKPKHTLAIYNGDEEVTNEVISHEGPQLILFVSDPKIHKKARASMTNNLNSYIERMGGTMIGVVATSPDSLDEWINIAKPDFDVFTAEDTTIKEIVRGDAGLVYTVDGKIVWKRTLYSLPGDFPEFASSDNALAQIKPIDSGVMIKRLTYLYIAVLASIYALGLIKLRRHARKVAKKTKEVK